MKLLEIGLTGGIGSGKSFVAKKFEARGYRVYYADDRAKGLYTTDAELKAGVIRVFGNEVYGEDGELNRAYLGNIVFQDRSKLDELNALVHPAVARDFTNWKQELLDQTYAHPFFLKEAAILFEIGTAKHSDGIITVFAPKSLRLARLVKYRGGDRAEHLARMDKQWSSKYKLFHSDYIIYNDGQKLETQIDSAITHFTPA